MGSHLKAALGAHRVTATYRGHPVPHAVPLDLRDTARLRGLIQETAPDAIVLAAAEAHVERCEREPEETRRVNVEPLRHILETSPGRSAALVVFSSEYVFRGEDGPYVEEDPIDPLNEYGRQKAAVEELARENPRHLICRTSAVFGWEAARKNFVCQMQDQLGAGRTFRVPSDQVVTPTYAPDLARAVVELLESEAWGTYHVVGPEVLARTELARAVAEVFGLDATLIRPLPTAEMGYAASRPSCAGLRDGRLRARLGRSLTAPGRALELMRDAPR